MHKRLACAALVLAGSLAGCGKDGYEEPKTARTEPRGHSTPTEVRRASRARPQR